jgi:shikimate dehydrogenase
MRLPIIGQTFTHSASEAVLRAAFETTGQQVEIERWERRPHQLADAIDDLRAPDVLGALIAAPHKERASGLLNALSDDAKLTGAVNLVVRDGSRLRGHNTDLDGVRAGLAALLPKVAGRWPRQAVVLGAGGGARAVVAVLISSGFQRIAVFNRHLHRAEALVADFARHARHMELRAQPWHETFIGSELAKARLLVNASGIGGEADEMPIPAELLPADLYLLDLVLHAENTPLMGEVRAREGTVANGQAAFLAGTSATYRLLIGQEAPADAMRAALSAELGAPEEGAAVVGD